MTRSDVLRFVIVLFAVAHLANAAEPSRLTTDGRVKRDPVFSKPDGSDPLPNK